jgi:hypothetical protein
MADHPAVTCQYEEWEVEIKHTVTSSIKVKVRAKNAASAALIADQTSFPLPPAGPAWSQRTRWIYAVREPGSEEVLYDGEAPAS